MTSPGFRGADVDALTRLGSSLDTAASGLESMRTATTGRLDAFGWQGQDARWFRQSWQEQFAPALQRASAALSSAAVGIGRHRVQQDAASDAGSVTPPAAAPAETPPAETPPAADAPADVAPSAPSTSASPAVGGAGPSTPAEPAAAAPAPAPSGGPGGGAAASVNVPFYSQFVAGHGFTPSDTACFKAATAMAHQSGADVLGPDQRIQVATGEAADGSVTVDASAAATGRSYIDQQLDSGRPVVVGVSHQDAAYNVDGITDHFVVITGRGTDDAGGTFYTFHDPSTRVTEKGADTNPANRFRVDNGGRMWSDGSRASGYVVDRHIEVSMVRRNR